MKNRFEMRVDGMAWGRFEKEVYAVAMVQLWNSHSGENARAEVVDLVKERKQSEAKRCGECDAYPATSGDLCEGCAAYSVHTSIY